MIRAAIATYKQSLSEPDFWVSYQLGAFQGDIDFDGDSNQEAIELGRNIIGFARGEFEQGSVAFRESARDAKALGRYAASLADVWRIVSVHESGHDWGLEDDLMDGSLMDYPSMQTAATQAEINALQFSVGALRLITERLRPGEIE